MLFQCELLLMDSVSLRNLLVELKAMHRQGLELPYNESEIQEYIDRYSYLTGREDY